MTARTRKYHQAALAYLIYGFIYLSGAVYLAEVGAVARSGWVWFLVGIVFLFVLPPLIWKEYKWITRVLAILVGVRIAGLVRIIITDNSTVPLPWDGAMQMAYGAAVFLVVAAGAGVMLVRAGWDWEFGREEHSGP